MRSSIINNSELELFGTQPQMPGMPRMPWIPRKWCQELQLGPPFTHAGGQDDGSLHKLPQTITSVANPDPKG